jgi:DNA-binding helix-hairpin-helix protein with protein kinase domain
MAATASLVDAKGASVVLGTELGRGGEGAVYDVRDQPGQVAKVYLAPPDRDHAAKLAAMAASADSRILKLAAWPTQVVNDKGGRAVGFLMPKVSGFRPAFELYGPKLRLKQFPKADWRFLIRAASNTARAFGVVHAAGHVIGDVNHGNLVVGQDATVRLIDCDSFQISAGSKTWFCTVGVPTHQPPEMQGMASYDGFVRTANHDNFGLAVLVFQLLCLARHPYSGRFIGSGDPPSIEDSIKQFRFAYGGDSRKTQMAAPPGSLPMDALTPTVRGLFEAAFLPAGAQRNGRPTSAQWISALDDLAAKTRQCSASSSHHYLATLTACPWCEIEARSKTLLFPAVFVSGQTGTDGFMLLWQQVTAVAVPGTRPAFPDPPKLAPSAEAKRAGVRLVAVYAVLAAAFVSCFAAAKQFAAPQAFAPDAAALVASFAFVTALVLAATGRRFKRAFRSSWKEWRELQRDWAAPARPDPVEVRNGLDKLKSSYDALQAERAAKLRKLHDNRRASQMLEYLDGFQIAGAKVRGVGQAKAAVLQSYGVETAADVVYATVIVISGFGPKTVQNLLDWRTDLERRFRFDASRGVAPADIATVENAVGLQRRLLEQRLASGLSDLRGSASREVAVRQDLGSRFTKLAPVYGQALADKKAAVVF